jgi:glycerol-3-phosphate O-acyltransferase
MRPLVPYEPNPMLGWLYHRFFDRIEVDEAWVSAVRQAEARGTVVYVLRNLSFVDFLALDHLTKRYELPQIRFANDMGLWILEPMGRGWLQALRPRKPDDAEDLRRTLARGCSAALFLKRPPTLLDGSVRGQIEGDAFLRTIIDVQKTSGQPILLMPQVFVWSKRPDEARYGLMDAVFGPREWPGKMRTVSQFLLSYRHPTLRAGEPLDVRAFLEQETARNGSNDEALVRRMTYALLRRLERERRIVLGPTKKPADRLREEVIRSPKLQKIIGDMAGHGAADRRALTAKAMEMLREMESTPDHNAITALDTAFKQVFARMYTALEVDLEGIERVRKASRDGTLILLPSHKSHVDYMILSYVFYQHHLQLPVVAAGDNLNFFPLGSIFRKAGAFFIRRSFGGDRLYGAVVDAYMRRLMKDGWSLEFFLEGARSRTGKLLPPKLGLLSIVVDAALGVGSKNVYFCPISIGYERMVEEKAYVREVTGGEKKKEDVRGLLSTIDVLLSRYGRLNIQFGEILTLESVFAESGGDPATLGKLTPPKRRGLVTRMGYRVMHEINRVTAVTPGALVAMALLVHGRRGISHADLVALCDRIAATLKGFGARFTPSAVATPGGTLRPEAVREACELFLRAGHVEARLPGAPVGSKEPVRAGGDAVYVVPDEGRLSLDLAKNVIVHFFVDRALVATVLLASGALRMDVDTLRERVQSLSRLFKYEFLFRADASFDTIFDETLDAMVKAGELVRTRAPSPSGRATLEPAPGGRPNPERQSSGSLAEHVQPAGEAGRAQVVLYAQIVRNFLESYRIAARGLTALLKGPMTPKDLTKRAITTGDRMFLAGEIERREAISRPVLDNAYLSFVDQGYLTREDGKLTLPESYASPATVRTIEAKIAGLLPKVTEVV